MKKLLQWPFVFSNTYLKLKQTNTSLFLLLYFHVLFLKLYKKRNINFRVFVFMQESCGFVSVFLDVALKFFRLLHVSVQVPGPAPNLQVVSVSTTSVTLSWERPITGNGEIQTYKLFYSEKGQDSEQVRTDESWKSSCSLETLLYPSHKLLNM